MSEDLYILAAICMGFLATYGARFLPYALFGRKKEGQGLLFIQQNMPLIIMLTLVFYTFFALNWSSFNHIVINLAACALVLVLQILFKNELLSIFCGVALYMGLLRAF